MFGLFFFQFRIFVFYFVLYLIRVNIRFYVFGLFSSYRGSKLDKAQKIKLFNLLSILKSLLEFFHQISVISYGFRVTRGQGATPAKKQLLKFFLLNSSFILLPVFLIVFQISLTVFESPLFRFLSLLLPVYHSTLCLLIPRLSGVFLAWCSVQPLVKLLVILELQA